MQTSSLAALAAALLAPLASADVLLVDDDGGPGVTHTDLQAAVDAAQPGDLLLVRDGAYDGFQVVAKPLTILADDGAAVRIAGDVLIADLAAGTLTLRGFRFPTAGSELRVVDSSGVVRLEHLDLSASLVDLEGDVLASRLVASGAGYLRLSSVRVGFDPERAVLAVAGLPATGPARPAAALALDGNTRAHLHACRIGGTPGRDGAEDPATLLAQAAQLGGHAIETTGAVQLRLVGTTAVGGAGGDGSYAGAVGCIAPADGGAGLRIAGAGFPKSVALEAGLLQGGAAGAPTDPGSVQDPLVCPAQAQDGAAIDQAKDVSVFYSASDAPRPELEVEAWIGEQEPVTLEVRREPGDLILVGLSAVTPTEVSLGAVGIEVGQPLLLFSLGVADGSGLAAITLPAVGDTLPAGAGAVVYTQAVAVDGVGTPFVGQFATSALLDAGF